jgi:Ni,Fe-hydrogenase III small subunit
MFVIDTISHRLKRGCETMAYPKGPAPRCPTATAARLRVDARQMRRRLPSLRARVSHPGHHPPGRAEPVVLDLGRCLFCAAVWRSVRRKPSRRPATTAWRCVVARTSCWARAGGAGAPGAALDEKLRRLFGRSLKLRQVSAGGCNACEADTNVLGTIGWDLGDSAFSSWHRHATRTDCSSPDRSEEHGTGAQEDLRRRAAPKIVIAVGACAIAGGPFVGHAKSTMVRAIVPVDMFIPGCPPHPLTILDGLLRLLDRLEATTRD